MMIIRGDCSQALKSITTALTSKNLNYNYITIEKEPKYMAVI